MEKSRWEAISHPVEAIDRHPEEVTPHTKTDSITDFNSLLVCFFQLCFIFSFKFYQEVL